MSFNILYSDSDRHFLASTAHMSAEARGRCSRKYKLPAYAIFRCLGLIGVHRRSSAANMLFSGPQQERPNDATGLHTRQGGRAFLHLLTGEFQNALGLRPIQGWHGLQEFVQREAGAR
jgi:hypothetical protein